MFKTKTKIRISKKWLLLALVIFICAATTAYAGTAAAPAGGTTGLTGDATNLFNQAMQSLANLLIAILQLLKKILWPIFLLIGGLLNNDLLFGSGMEERLLLIWTQIRNFVNIGFVLILVGVALYNVTGFAKEEYDVKKFIPKFALALIAVNFSFIGLKLVLDVTNVFTVAIFAMPKTISSSIVSANSLAVPKTQGSTELVQRCHKDDTSNTSACDAKTADQTKTERERVQSIVNSVCGALYGTIDKFNKPAAAEKIFCEEGQSATTTKDGKTTTTRNYQLTQDGLKFFNSFTSNNAAIVIAMQFMNIVDVDTVSTTLGKSSDFMKLTLNLMFSTILYIIYGTAYVALFILLLVRLVVLWLIIVLSPLIALKLAGIKVAEGGDDYGKMFIQHAVAPIKIAVVLTVGYMMLDVFRTVKVMGADNKADLQTTIGTLQTELSGISTLQSFIMAAAAVIFIWVGVKQATKETKAGGIIEGMMSKVQAAGKSVAGLWKYAPLIPTQEGKASFMQLQKNIQRPLNDLRTKYGGEAGEGELTVEQIQEWKRQGRSLPKERFNEALPKLGSGMFTKSNLTEEAKGLFRTWEQGSTEQKRLITKLKEKAGGDQAWKEFMKKGGRLSSGAQVGIQNVLRNAGTPTPPAPRAPGAPAGKPPVQQTTQTPGDADTNMMLAASNDGDKGNLAYRNLEKGVQDKVSQLVSERKSAQATTDLTKRAAAVAAVDEKMKDPDYTKAVAAVKATTQVQDDLTTKVSTAAAAGKDTLDRNQKSTLSAALKTAEQKLTSTGSFDKDKIKAILTETLKKAGVTDAAAKDLIK